MALLKYFNRVNSSSGTVLPNPESSLNRVVDQKVIKAANEEVTKVRLEGRGAKRGLPPLNCQVQTRHICHLGYPPLFHRATLPRLQVSIYPGRCEIPSHCWQFHMSHDEVSPSFTCSC